VVGPKLRFPDLQGSFEKRLGLRISAPTFVRGRQVGAGKRPRRGGRARVSPRRSPAAFEEGLGLRIPTLQNRTGPPGCSGYRQHRGGRVRVGRSRILRPRLRSGSASAYRAVASYRRARLFSWWQRRGGRAQALLLDLEATLVKRLGPPHIGPVLRTGPPGCSGWRPRRGGRARASPRRS